MAKSVHKDAIVVDSLVVSNWGPDVFRSIHAGGVTAMNATVAVWENFPAAMENIAQWHRWFIRHGDILMQVRRTDDILAAKKAGKLGVVLGFQNGAPIADNADMVRVFKALGIGIIQITYNNQNLIGSGCYERVDGGLSDYGRMVVDEMNACGIAIDLSHVGAQTSADAIAHSKKPVCFSHANPKALKDHARNKDDDLIRALVKKGGYVGINLFPLFMPDQANKTVDHIVVMLDHLIELVGEDHVGIGTDLTEGHGAAFWRWICLVNGRGDVVLDVPPEHQGMLIRHGRDWPLITQALERGGYSESRVRKILGLNFIRFLKEAWNEA
jgi:membrane dipeptidase